MAVHRNVLQILFPLVFFFVIYLLLLVVLPISPIFLTLSLKRAEVLLCGPHSVPHLYFPLTLDPWPNRKQYDRTIISFL